MTKHWSRFCDMTVREKTDLNESEIIKDEPMQPNTAQSSMKQVLERQPKAASNSLGGAA